MKRKGRLGLSASGSVTFLRLFTMALLRDQLAAMVADRYDHLQVLATVALGKRKADELLPALRSSAGFARAVSVSAAVPAANGATAPVAAPNA